ncbi:MAG: DegT/DnrJ/EryC1/StrS family aminotransferase [Lentisphaerae bacterium]|nr:DegT/DnrJ/EryC1/StrS family aminotransferase [Lentisphaerota bacterium]
MSDSLNATAKRKFVKYSIDELMEVVDVFNVSNDAQSRIRAILEKEPESPDAGNFFRYYNEKSKTLELEEVVRNHVGAKHVLAVNSGTSSIIAALVATGIGPGDEVIVPGYTFFASASAVVVAKGIPVIAEIDESLTLDPVSVEKNITKKTKAIMPVHMLGLPSKMDELRAIAKKYNLKIIEDNAQSFGGKYKGEYLGTTGDIGCISLDAYKVIGSGEGGLLITDDDCLYMRAQSYHDTGACWRPNRFEQERKPGELFCGENYRMNELAAAVALAQMRKLDSINESTRAAWNQFHAETKLPSCAKWIEHNDPEGVCGYVAGILFENKEQAIKVANAKLGLGGMATGYTRGVRDWHVYWNWEHILEQKTATPEGCPFTCPHVEKLPDYSPDMCPRTKDIMLRLATVHFAPFVSADQVSKQAETISKGLADLF